MIHAIKNMAVTVTVFPEKGFSMKSTDTHKQKIKINKAAGLNAPSPRHSSKPFHESYLYPQETADVHKYKDKIKKPADAKRYKNKSIFYEISGRKLCLLLKEPLFNIMPKA